MRRVQRWCTITVLTACVCSTRAAVAQESQGSVQEGVQATGVASTSDAHKDARDADMRSMPARRWIPQHLSIGVGGVATSSPDRGTTYTPTLGGSFDAAMIGYLTPKLAWRAEGFLYLHDRSVASETGILSDALPCPAGNCTREPRETSRRSVGFGVGIEHHPMRGRVGVYTVAMLGAAGTNSMGEAGKCLGFAPSLGVGLLAPMSTKLDGFAVEARWRRVPTVLGAVNAGSLSLVLRF